jgi:hypothetical protein
MSNRSLNHDILQNQIILALNNTKLCRVWSQPTGAAYREEKLIKYGLMGCADITGLMIDGRRLEVEVKTGKAMQSEQQKLFERMILSKGGIYFVARSVEDALSSLEHNRHLK